MIAKLDLERHPFFDEWRDPVSGASSYVLTERVAPVQQSLYFATPSVSWDGRWLWFYCAHPPGAMRTLGAVCLDPDRPEIRHFPNAQHRGHFETSTTLALPGEPEGMYLCMGPSVWRLSLDGTMTAACTLDADFIAGRRLERLSCRLSASSDGRYFLLVGQIANSSFVALGERDSGRVRVLHEFPRAYAHASFSPTEPELFMLCQEWHKDPVSGHRFDNDIHTWLMDIGQTRFEPILAQGWSKHGRDPNHEFWSEDGWVCWADLSLGGFEWHPGTKARNHVWRRPVCHAHASPDRQFWCADQTPYRWESETCQVLFYDRGRDRELPIVSAMPCPSINWRELHLHPHPQFVLGGRHIVYTTTLLGRPDVAIAPVASLHNR